MSSGWPMVRYEEWHATCDTLHAHTQVLGKLSTAMAPREPELRHAALRLSARGWETKLLPAPNGPGAIVAALDLRAHEAVVEHTDGRAQRVPLAPDRPVGEVTHAVLEAVGELAGAVQIDPTPRRSLGACRSTRIVSTPAMTLTRSVRTSQPQRAPRSCSELSGRRIAAVAPRERVVGLI